MSNGRICNELGWVLREDAREVLSAEIERAVQREFGPSIFRYNLIGAVFRGLEEVCL
jgi:hypothetical protein